MMIRSGLILGAAILAAWNATPLTSTSLGQPDPRAEAMRAHFDAALEVHAAVSQGDLVAAGARAEALARGWERDQQGVAPSPHQAGVLEAARAVPRATDVLGAARATADLLNACGRCHRATRVAPAFAPFAPARAETLAERMQAHRKAIDLLLEGLIVPSDEAWRSGARALATAALYDPGLPVDPAVRQALAAMEQRFHRLATDAAQSTNPRARAAFYAQFLAGCADCHMRHRPAR